MPKKQEKKKTPSAKRAALTTKPARDSQPAPEPEPQNLGGRPRKDFSFPAFEQMCHAQCTLEEIASFFFVSEDTVERRCKEYYGEGFADTYKKLSAGGKSSLRRWQFKAAQKGNVAMLIWLGKNLLGQTDKQEHSGHVGMTFAELAAAAAQHDEQ